MIGVSQKDLSKAVGKLSPNAMAMGSTGGAMEEMEMPMPDNALTMMGGPGQFGAIEMGGMFTTMKICEGMGRDDYSDPGPYKFPKGTVAYEIDAPPSAPPRPVSSKTKSKPAEPKQMKGMDMKGMKGM